MHLFSLPPPPVRRWWRPRCGGPAWSKRASESVRGSAGRCGGLLGSTSSAPASAHRLRGERRAGGSRGWWWGEGAGGQHDDDDNDGGDGGNAMLLRCSMYDEPIRGKGGKGVPYCCRRCLCKHAWLASSHVRGRPSGQHGRRGMTKYQLTLHRVSA